MIRNVLVPLDMSAFAEQALPPAIAIARRSQAQLHLLHVRTLSPAPAYSYVDWWSEAVRDEEAEYLRQIAGRVGESTGLTPLVHAREGRIADEIRRQATRIGANLIVMTTHGRTGLSRTWLGSVADALVRQDDTPVLMIRPSDDAGALDEHPLYSHILVPLDGSPSSEIALERATMLGSLAHARYTLVRIVAPVFVPVHPAVFAGGASRPDSDATDIQLQFARDYLAVHAQRLVHAGMRVDTTVQLSDYPASGILAMARDAQADLVVMCTHRQRVARLLLGSTADKVLRAGTTALLLMHPSRASSHAL